MNYNSNIDYRTLFRNQLHRLKYLTYWIIAYSVNYLHDDYLNVGLLKTMSNSSLDHWHRIMNNMNYLPCNLTFNYQYLKWYRYFDFITSYRVYGKFMAILFKLRELYYRLYLPYLRCPELRWINPEINFIADNIKICGSIFETFRDYLKELRD